MYVVEVDGDTNQMQVRRWLVWCGGGGGGGVVWMIFGG